jgi:hypothetical protein
MTRRLLLVLVALALAPAPARGQRPIRFEGYWDRPTSAPDVPGEQRFTAEGHAERRFGVTALQAYFPNEEGIQIFQRSLKPVLVVRGPKELVERFFAAGPDRKVVAMGTLSRDVVLGSVEVAAPAAEEGNAGTTTSRPVDPP